MSKILVKSYIIFTGYIKVTGYNVKIEVSPDLENLILYVCPYSGKRYKTPIPSSM